MLKKKLTGAEIIIKALLNEGVKTVFGYPGGAILPFYDMLHQQNDLRHILVRHEQAAAHAAEGFARSTGKVGVLIVTSGPGATNVITGLTDAFLDSTPIICISGQVPTSIIGTDGFQEADITGLTRSCTKHNYLVRDVKDLGYIIHEAFHVARSGRPGPVLIDIPKDVQNAEFLYEGKPAKITRESLKTANIIKSNSIEDVIELIKKAKKPLIYSGGGIINSGPKAATLLTEFVKITGFPITSTLMGLGSYPDKNDSQFLGMVGMHGSYEANMAMYECDLMINIGARFDDRVTGRTNGFSPNSKKIHIDIDESSINKIIDVDVAIIGDAANILEKLIKTYKNSALKNRKNDIKEWLLKIKKWQDKNSFGFKDSNKIIKPQKILNELFELTKDKNPFVTTDVGQHQMWAAQHIKFSKPYRWITSGGLGTMGYGLPAAIGAQIANPKELVYCVSGEASFMMNMQELSTVKQYNLPVKIFILNNQYMGMVRQWQELTFENRESQSYMKALPDFAKFAESFGIKAITCDNPKKIKDQLKEAINYNGPVLFNCLVDRSENVFPMIPAGAAHNEMWLDKNKST